MVASFFSIISPSTVEGGSCENRGAAQACRSRAGGINPVAKEVNLL